MSNWEQAPITKLMREAEAGRPMAADELFRAIDDRMRRLAQEMIRSEPKGIRATALYNEAVARIPRDVVLARRDRTHLAKLFGLAMRRILTDWARQRRTIKRGGGVKQVALDEAEIAGVQFVDLPGSIDEQIDLAEALGRLTDADADAYQVVLQRHVLKRTVPEVCALIGMDAAEVRRHLAVGESLLQRFLEGYE